MSSSSGQALTRDELGQALGPWAASGRRRRDGAGVRADGGMWCHPPPEDAELNDVPRLGLHRITPRSVYQRARLEQQEVGALHRDARTIRIAEVGRHRLERDAPDDTPFIALPGHRAGCARTRGLSRARSRAGVIGLVAVPSQGRSQAPGPGPVAAGVAQRGDPVGHPEPARVEQRSEDTLLRCDLRTQSRELCLSPVPRGLGVGVPRGVKLGVLCAELFEPSPRRGELLRPSVRRGEVENAVCLQPLEQRIAIPLLEDLRNRVRPRRVALPSNPEAKERPGLRPYAGRHALTRSPRSP